MAEDVAPYGGCYAMTKGLLQEFRQKPIREIPLSKETFFGCGIRGGHGPEWSPNFKK